MFRFTLDTGYQNKPASPHPNGPCLMIAIVCVMFERAQLLQAGELLGKVLTFNHLWQQVGELLAYHVYSAPMFGDTA